MKINLSFIVFLLVLFSAVTFPAADTLYFCESYTGGKEIGNDDLFEIGPGGGSITVMLRTNYPVGCTKVVLDINRIWGEDNSQDIKLEPISKKDFYVNSGWTYIFFSDVFFQEDGIYLVALYTEDEYLIAQNVVYIAYRE